MTSSIPSLLFVLCLLCVVSSTFSKKTEKGQHRLLVSPYKVEGRVLHVPREQRKEIVASLSRKDQQYTALIRDDGRFVFHNISSGSFILRVASPSLSFPILRVDVSGKFPGKVKAKTTGPTSEEFPYPIRLEPLGHKVVFEIREGFNIMGYLKSPMVLMMVATFSLLGCSQMLQSLDPEAAAEMERSKLESRFLGHAILDEAN